MTSYCPQASEALKASALSSVCHSSLTFWHIPLPLELEVCTYPSLCINFYAFCLNDFHLHICVINYFLYYKIQLDPYLSMNIFPAFSNSFSIPISSLTTQENTPIWLRNLFSLLSQYPILLLLSINWEGGIFCPPLLSNSILSYTEQNL